MAITKFVCESCGAEVPRNAKFCKSCGKFFASVRCPACGYVGEQSVFVHGCPKCGYAVGMGPIAVGSKVAPRRPVVPLKHFPQRGSTRTTQEDSLPSWVYAVTIGLLVGIVAGMLLVGQ